MSTLLEVDLSAGICQNDPPIDLAAWVPETQKQAKSKDTEKAKSNCRECSVQEDCLAAALQQQAAGLKPFGVWGGEVFLQRW